MTSPRNGLIRLGRFAKCVARGGVRPGRCPICERTTLFVKEGDWLRDQYKCMRCKSIPRWRALISVLNSAFPGWRDLAIHESSPGGASSEKLARECRRIVQSHYYPGQPLGSMKDGFRCEDLEQQTFADASFDLVITQDVFEHIPDPTRGFAEIARTLKPGGAHVFTVPWFYWKPTLVRAAKDADGNIVHLEKPDYHGNPIDVEGGSLVTAEWGWDLPDFIYRVSGLTTTAIRNVDPSRGIEGEFLEVFISRKAGEASHPRPAGAGSTGGIRGEREPVEATMNTRRMSEKLI